MDQVILNNGMRTNAANIKYKRRKLVGKKFDITLLETLYKLRGRDLKTSGIVAAMGYSPKSAGAGVRINKALVRLERDGYVRVIGSKRATRQFFVLKGIPEIDKQLSAYPVPIPPAPAEPLDETEQMFKNHHDNVVLSETLYPEVNLSNIVGRLKQDGVKFTITISNEGSNERPHDI